MQFTDFRASVKSAVSETSDRISGPATPPTRARKRLSESSPLVLSFQLVGTAAILEVTNPTVNGTAYSFALPYNFAVSQPFWLTTFSVVPGLTIPAGKRAMRRATNRPYGVSRCTPRRGPAPTGPLPCNSCPRNGFRADTHHQSAPRMCKISSRQDACLTWKANGPLISWLSSRRFACKWTAWSAS